MNKVENHIDAHQESDDHEVKDLVGTQVAALFLDLSCSVLRKDRRTRHLGIPFIKYGPRAVRYSMKALREYKNTRTVTTPEAHP